MSYVYTGTVSLKELTELLSSLPEKSKEFKLLENVVNITFEKYSSEANLDIWEKGRVFGETGEVKWRKIDEEYHAVYLGKSPLEGILEKQNFNDELEEPEEPEERERSYFLWGAKTKDKSDEWMELRIPRLLNYPVKGEKDRVKLKVVEYINKSGKILHYRYKGLEEVEVK